MDRRSAAWPFQREAEGTANVEVHTGFTDARAACATADTLPALQDYRHVPYGHPYARDHSADLNVCQRDMGYRGGVSVELDGPPVMPVALKPLPSRRTSCGARSHFDRRSWPCPHQGQGQAYLRTGCLSQRSLGIRRRRFCPCSAPHAPDARTQCSARVNHRTITILTPLVSPRFSQSCPG